MRTYKIASSEDESKGIDGYIESTPVSIKPTTYSQMNMLPEEIKVSIIYYKKTKTGLNVEYSF